MIHAQSHLILKAHPGEWHAHSERAIGQVVLPLHLDPVLNDYGDATPGDGGLPAGNIWAYS